MTLNVRVNHDKRGRSTTCDTTRKRSTIMFA